MLVHCSTEVTDRAVDFEKDLIQMPLIPGLRPPATQLVGVGLAEFAAPLTDRLVGHMDPAGGQEFFDIAIAEREAEVEPDGMGNDFGGEAVAFVRGSRSSDHAVIIHRRRESATCAST